MIFAHRRHTDDAHRHTDLWNLARERQTDSLSAELEANFYARCPPEQRPHHYQEPYATGEPEPASRRSGSDTFEEDYEAEEKVKPVTPDPDKPESDDIASTVQEEVIDDQGKGKDGPKAQSKSKSKSKKPQYDASLAKALHKTFFWRFWIAGTLKLLSGTPIASSYTNMSMTDLGCQLLQIR